MGSPPGEMLAGIFHKKACFTEDGYFMLPQHGPSDRHRSVKATHMHQKPHHHATSQCDKTGKVLDCLGGNAKSLL
jgi:hypothetical protein